MRVAGAIWPYRACAIVWRRRTSASGPRHRRRERDAFGARRGARLRRRRNRDRRRQRRRLSALRNSIGRVGRRHGWRALRDNQSHPRIRQASEARLPRRRAASRAACSIASICLDCCSSARNVSQLVSRLVSTVRLGAGSVPLSATITAGRAAPAACGGALSVSSASSMASARSTLTVACRSAPSAWMTMSRKRACPALMLMRGGCLRHRQAGIVERAGDEFANAIAARSECQARRRGSRRRTRPD